MMKTLVLKKIHRTSELPRHQRGSFLQSAVKSARAQRKTIELDVLRTGKEQNNRLCQQLTGVALLSEALAHKLGRKMPAESAEASEIAELISRTISESLNIAEKILSIETQIMKSERKEVTGAAQAKKSKSTSRPSTSPRHRKK